MAITRDPRWRFPLLHTANGALLVGLLLFGLQNWDKLPDRMPIHFGFSGEPDRFTDKGFEVAFVLFILPLLLTVLLYGVFWLVHVFSQNPLAFGSGTRKLIERVPRNKRYLAIDHVKETLGLLVLGVLALLWSINTGMVGVALGELEGLGPWRVLPFVLALIALKLWRYLALRRLTASLTKGA